MCTVLISSLVFVFCIVSPLILLNLRRCRLDEYISIGQMALAGVYLNKTNDRATENVAQYQTSVTCMCRLILLYTLRKINAWSRMVG